MKSIRSIFLFLPLFCMAQVPVVETGNGKGGYEKDREVILRKLDIETRIAGGLSTQVVTMVLKNNSSRLREGRLTFPLPEGVNVGGYALDINGKLRNAVPVEKEKAREVYESIKKRNVDPGILEKTEGNTFRTVVYPISPNGGERTVQITYDSELKRSGKGYQYFLPLNPTSAIPEFHLKTTVFRNTGIPRLEERPDGSFDFIRTGNTWTAEITKTDYHPGSSLKINIPNEAAGQDMQAVLLQQASGNSSYFMAHMDMPPAERKKVLPRELAVVWDNSLSGLKRDHVKEWALLSAYLKSNTDLTVNTYLVNNTFEEGEKFTIRNGDWSSLKTYLSGMIYDGGTDFGRLQPVKGEEILFFTDGLSSFGDLQLKWKQPVYTIVSSSNANFSQLKFISNTTGGELLNLIENDPGKEVRKLLFQSLKFLGIENNASVSEVYPSLKPTISEDFILTGILQGSRGSVVLKFGYGDEVTQRKTITMDAAEQRVEDWEISRFWAQKKLSELEIFERQNRAEIKALSRQFGIVSSNMSLMVLENAEDYVRYDILPPAELKGRFDRMVKDNRILKDERVRDLMKSAEQIAVDLKEWWKQEYEQPLKRYPAPVSGYSGRDTLHERDIQEVVVTGVLRRTGEDTDTGAAEVAATESGNRIEEVVMTGPSRVIRRKEVTSASVTAEPVREHPQVSIRGMSSIASQNVVQTLQGRVYGLKVNSSTIKESAVEIINPGRSVVMDVVSQEEYMKLFNGIKNPEEIYQAYLGNRKTFEGVPQYYFDVSQLLIRSNDFKNGLKVLSSIADLDLENEELYKLLAYRLKQAGSYEKELLAVRKVLEWRPFDPQSYRDYALALEDNGQYQPALENLYKILTQSYTRELADRDQGIEETVVMEINELVSRQRNRLDLKEINPAILADLPVDVRVVLNWNKDDTDIDLWVTDPNNERCYYSHKQTAIGGRLSDDFTSGFGPEQFLLKKAVAGKYKIQTNFFGERQAGAAGPTAIMAEVYIHYATGRQERKIVVFQNDKNKSHINGEEGIVIGEFEF